MREFLEYLQQEWATLAGAPFAFLIALALSSAAIIFGARRWFEKVIAELREQVATLKERIEGKDEILDQYRERLRIIEDGKSNSGTAYSRLSDDELKRRTLLLVGQLRDFISRRERESREFSDSLWRRRDEAETEERRRELWHRETSEYSQQHFKTSAEYDQHFRVEAILLRDELLSRLPDEAVANRRPHTSSTYEHPTNFFGYREVADDLERLGRILEPSSQ